MSDEQNSSAGVEPAADAAPVEADTAAWLASKPTVAKELHPSKAPPADEAEPSPGVGEQLVSDEQELENWLSENPTVAARFQPPKTDAAALAQAEIVRDLKRLQELEQASAAENAYSLAENAYAEILGEDPVAAQQAVNTLISTVGLENPETKALLDFWQSEDPGAVSEWARVTADQIAQYQAYQTRAALDKNQAELAKVQEERQAAFAKATKEFQNSPRVDVERYGGKMAELAAASGLLDVDPQNAPAALAALHESARQLDPDAEPYRDLDGVHQSASWERARQADMLNALPGTGSRLLSARSTKSLAQQIADWNSEHPNYQMDSRGHVTAMPVANIAEVERATRPHGVESQHQQAREQILADSLRPSARSDKPLGLVRGRKLGKPPADRRAQGNLNDPGDYWAAWDGRR
jgi:hypothetical protein